MWLAAGFAVCLRVCVSALFIHLALVLFPLPRFGLVPLLQCGMQHCQSQQPQKLKFDSASVHSKYQA